MILDWIFYSLWVTLSRFCHLALEILETDVKKHDVTW